MFRWSELRRLAGHARQANVLRHHQCRCAMRPGASHDPDDAVFRVGGPDVSQAGSHLFGMHDGADHPVPFSLQRADRPVHIVTLPFVPSVHHRTLRRGSPSAPNPHHASQASLVLTQQPHVTPRDFIGGQQECQHVGEFCFHSSCPSGLCLGWRVSGGTFRQPWRANKR